MNRVEPNSIVVETGGQGKNCPPRRKTFGQNQNFSGTDNEQFRTIQISEQKIRSNVNIIFFLLIFLEVNGAEKISCAQRSHRFNVKTFFCLHKKKTNRFCFIDI